MYIPNTYVLILCLLECTVLSASTCIQSMTYN